MKIIWISREGIKVYDNFYTKNLFEVLQYPKNTNKLTLPLYRDLCQK